jgi:hypothetical protein
LTPTLRRDLGIAAAVLFVLLVVVGLLSLRLWDWWRYRGEISVDFDPEGPSGLPPGSFQGWARNPDGSLAAASVNGKTFVVDTRTGDAVADLGDLEATIFVGDEVLVAFGREVWGPGDGLAVVDLAHESVDQVEERGGAEGGLYPVRLRSDGQVLVCQWFDNGSDQVCEPGRWFLDPDAGTLEPVPVDDLEAGRQPD